MALDICPHSHPAAATVLPPPGCHSRLWLMSLGATAVSPPWPFGTKAHFFPATGVNGPHPCPAPCRGSATGFWGPLAQTVLFEGTHRGRRGGDLCLPPRKRGGYGCHRPLGRIVPWGHLPAPAP